ncbi:MAG: prenyltransferase [Chloroflexus sp.]
MSRPLILPSGVLAYAVGVAMALADGPIDWGRQAIGLTLTMLANLAAHYADEYADADTDALAHHTGVSGGSGAIAFGYADRTLALQAALVVTGITLLGGAWATLHGAIPLAAGVILLVGLLGGWAYSMPPIALERRGWGEFTNALLGGLLMPLMAYACAHDTPPLRVYAQLAPVVAAATGASAHTTGLHDNCTNLNRQYPHGLGRVGARDRTSGTPVTSFHRSTRLYNAAEGHNGTLDADNDGIACEKR